MRCYDTIICDVDGVLIDVSQSFTAASIAAVQVGTGSNRFTESEVRMLKSTSGFNDDWHVAVAGAAWAKFVPDLEFAKFRAIIQVHGGGLEAVAAVPGVILSDSFANEITRLAKEAYAGADGCRLLYGFNPRTLQQRGLHSKEQPLPGARELRGQVVRLGIVSGRTKREMALASGLLGWHLADDLMGLSDAPHSNKPNPQKLLEIAARLGGMRFLYAGDSRDDFELVHNARSKMEGSLDFALIGPGQPVWNKEGYRFDNIEMMMKNIEVINE